MMDYQINSPDCGPGAWCFNSTLLDHEEFKLLLKETITQFLDMTNDLNTTPALHCDKRKAAIKETAIYYSRRHSSFKKH